MLSWEWLAGLLEGEGCFHITKKKQPVIVISSTDFDVLVSAQDVTSAGNITTLKIAGREHYKAQWQWRVNRWDDILRIIENVRPFMHQRRLEAMDKIVQLRIEKTT